MLSSCCCCLQAKGQVEVQLPTNTTAVGGAAGAAGSNELYCGGVYVQQYLKDPGWPLRDPRRFVEGLLERYSSEIQALGDGQGRRSSSGGSGSSAVAVAQSASRAGQAPPVLQLVATAAVEVLRAHPALCDHVVKLGYGTQLLSQLSSGLSAATTSAPTQAGAGVPGSGGGGQGVGTAPAVCLLQLQLLHQLSYSQLAAEGLSTITQPEVAPLLLKCLSSWPGPASVLALECLKRLLSTANRNRDLVVRQALGAGLLQQLLQFLDWRRQQSGDADQQDMAVLKVLAVEVVTALAEPGLYTPQVMGSGRQGTHALWVTNCRATEWVHLALLCLQTSQPVPRRCTSAQICARAALMCHQCAAFGRCDLQQSSIQALTDTGSYWFTSAGVSGAGRVRGVAGVPQPTP